MAPEEAGPAFTDLTAGKLGNVVVDATGSAKSMSGAYHYVGFAGRLVWVGITQDPITVTQPLMHRREMTFLASRNPVRTGGPAHLVDHGHAARVLVQGDGDGAIYALGAGRCRLKLPQGKRPMTSSQDIVFDRATKVIEEYRPELLPEWRRMYHVSFPEFGEWLMANFPGHPWRTSLIAHLDEDLRAYCECHAG